MSRHTCDRVIENENGIDPLVINNVNKSGNAGVHKGRVTNNRHKLACKLFALHLCHTVCRADRCTHANGGVNCRKRCNCTKGVASDVARNGNTQFVEHIEGSAVRTSCTHNGGTTGNLLFKRNKLCGIYAQNSLFDHRGGIFAKHGEKFFTLDVNAHRAAGILNKWIQLFNNVNGFALGGKIL